MEQEIILTKEECNLILQSTGEYIRGGITRDGETIEIDEMRTCYEFTFVDNQELYNLLFPKLQKFGIKSLPSNMTVVRYEEGQHFENHADRGIGHEDRIKTVSIQLTEKNEYDGGYFIVGVYDSETNTKEMTSVSKEIGNVVIFDSSFYHYVNKITKGTRYALVFWLKEENLI